MLPQPIDSSTVTPKLTVPVQDALAAGPTIRPVPPGMHPIRLQGPWELRLGKNFAEQRQVRLPALWQTLDVPPGEPARLSRRFQSPTGLTPRDRLLLLIPSGGVVQSIVLNGQRLRPEQQFDFSTDGVGPAVVYDVVDFTARLEPSNRLEWTMSARLLDATAVDPVANDPFDVAGVQPSHQAQSSNGSPVLVESVPQLQHPVIIGIVPG